jgi:hypothetical protein
VFFRVVLKEDLGCASSLVAGAGVPMLSKEGIELVEGEYGERRRRV